MVTVAGDGTVAGAGIARSKRSFRKLVPLQPVPDTVQVTAVFDVPVTEAANCCVAPTVVDAVGGVTATATTAPKSCAGQADHRRAVCRRVAGDCQLTRGRTRSGGIELYIQRRRLARTQRDRKRSPRQSETRARQRCSVYRYWHSTSGGQSHGLCRRRIHRHIAERNAGRIDA